MTTDRDSQLEVEDKSTAEGEFSVADAERHLKFAADLVKGRVVDMCEQSLRSLAELAIVGGAGVDAAIIKAALVGAVTDALEIFSGSTDPTPERRRALGDITLRDVRDRDPRRAPYT